VDVVRDFGGATLGLAGQVAVGIVQDVDRADGRRAVRAAWPDRLSDMKVRQHAYMSKQAKSLGAVIIEPIPATLGRTDVTSQVRIQVRFQIFVPRLSVSVVNKKLRLVLVI
jgi:hypothetical protein